MRTFLSSRRIGLLAVLAAVVLSAPSVPTDWYLDDLIHRAQFLEIGPMTDSSHMTNRMYDFLTDPEQIHAYKDFGVLPWWADNNLKIRFWRPLSSFTHVVDYTLWPDSGVLMHLQSVLWLAGLVAATAVLYRRLIAVPAAAGLATLLFAIDDAHGMPVAFLANRNAIVAATFGVLGLWLHDRYRRDGFAPGAILSPLAFLGALLAGESGIGIAPYFLGYPLFLEKRPGVLRFATIVPHALVGVAWLAFYTASGYGTSGTSFYLDPVGQPGAWFRESLVRAPLLLLGQWFVPPSSFALIWSKTQAVGVAVFGVGFLVVVFHLLRPILRDDASARFFFFGMLLAVVPITAGFPHDRLLFFVGIGAMPLLASLLMRLFDRSFASGWGRFFGWALVAVHVMIAAPLHLMMSASVAAQEPLYANPPRSLPNDPGLEEQKLLVVNHPSAFYGQYTLAVRAFDGTPIPRSMLQLAPGNTTLTVERTSPETLTIEAAGGWLGTAFDSVYRDLTTSFPSEYEIQLTDVRIRVLETTPDGRPKKAEFAFTTEIEDESLRWVRYQDGRYVPFDVPAIGQSVVLEPVEFNLFSPPPPLKEDPE